MNIAALWITVSFPNDVNRRGDLFQVSKILAAAEFR